MEGADNATLHHRGAGKDRRTVQGLGGRSRAVWFYIELVVLALAVIAFSVWFVRTSLFRAHRHGNWRDPGQTGTGRSNLGN
jgi:hypothetical protein